MTRFDAIVVGGGPAGSTAARELAQAGARVAVIDRAVFPRDKVCAGWITPAVVRALDLDLVEYGRTNTLQVFHGFDTAVFGGRLRRNDFGRPVSYGIRRSEFDHYLLARSRATLIVGEAVVDVARDAGGWIVSGRYRAPILIGAGGHFCPVARSVVRHDRVEPVVVAQEVEYRPDGAEAAASLIAPARPTLIFWPDLMGYGWCVQKGPYLNVGVGRITARAFPAAVAEFRREIERRGLLPGGAPPAFKGHAYLVGRLSPRPTGRDGVLLVGDAAGLALAPSGEGILAAVESAQLAAVAVLGSPTAARASTAYANAIEVRFGRRGDAGWTGHLPAPLLELGGRLLLGSRLLTRRVLLEQAFLHEGRPPLETRATAAGGSFPSGR
jgi:flavin-dependent dehydrogenase